MATVAPAELSLARTEVSSAVLDGRIVVVGGLTADGGASDRVDVYDPATNSWLPGREHLGPGQELAQFVGATHGHQPARCSGDCQPASGAGERGLLPPRPVAPAQAHDA